MKHFSDIPIAKKLITITLATTVTALLLASLMQAATEGLAYRDDISHNLATMGEVIGTNSVAALIFEDEKLAQQVLQSLEAEPAIIDGHIYHADGELMAAYYAGEISHDDIQLGASAKAQRISQWIATGEPVRVFNGLKSLDIVQPIHFDQETIGYVHLQASMASLVQTLVRFAWMAVITVALAILVAYFLSFRLQAVISRPILALANLMGRVTKDEDYSLRAEKSGDDEVGGLIDGFNTMLARISEREQRLKESRQRLDAQARSLTDANDKLKIAMSESITAKETAEMANSAKSEFLARMSHEIRTPMNGVLGMTELIIQSQLNSKQRHFAETIQDSANALLNLINDILDFSKIEAGKLELEEAEFDLRDVVEGVVELLSIRAQNKGLELLCDIMPTMDTLVRGDPTRLRQILTNLIGNALKFTQDGEVIVRVRADGIDSSGPKFRFEVIDTGIGIRPESHDMIFELFSQEDGSTTRRYGGTGLGLAICKQLAGLMGGEIGVNSSPGDKTTFWFTASFKSGTRAFHEHTLSDLEDPGSLKVLIVDDNETNREILVHQLAAWDITADSAENGESALALLQNAANHRSPYHLAILDWHMPGMDGLELAKAIRSDASLQDTRMIMLTSAAADDGGRCMDDAGIKAYVSKPARPAQLRKCIAKAIGAMPVVPARGDTSATRTVKALTNFAGGHILLVEDNPVNREVATQMLIAMQCQVHEVTNGQEAAEIVRKTQFDLILMDCEMPVMDGYEATEAIRAWESDLEEERHTPIIALTAHALPEDRRRCLSCGMDDYLSKPFSMEDLRALLIHWLSSIDIPSAVENRSDSLENRGASASESVPIRSSDGNETVSVRVLETISALDPKNGKALTNRVIGVYQSNSSELIESIANALEERDENRIRTAAHALKSSSGNVGAERLVGMCKEIEFAARANEMDGMLERLSAVRLEHKKVLARLGSWGQE
jgi:two-component system sensor histidine kinase/response regulator